MFGLISELEKRETAGQPIRFSVIGCGAMGGALVLAAAQTPGLRADIVCNRTVEKAIRTLRNAGVPEDKIALCRTQAEAEAALAAGLRVVTDDYRIACAAAPIEIVCESTGVQEIYARAAMEAIAHKKHYITYNVECDVCVGHLISRWAKQAGVIYSGIYGDEPGCAMLLYQEARLCGMEVAAIGRSDQGGSKLEWNPETIRPVLVRKHLEHYDPYVFASFCDGSKLHEESCMMANATGLRPDVRGMHGPTFSSWNEIETTLSTVLCPKEDGGILEHAGVTDYIGNDIMESKPGDPNFIWEFVVVKAVTPAQKAFIVKGGGVLKGDYGLLHMPYHRNAAQAPATLAVVALNGQPVIAPLEKRTADVVTMAKRDLRAGEIIDAIGGFCTVGRIESAAAARREHLLPFALAAGAELRHDIPCGSYLTYEDVRLPEKPSLLCILRQLQDETTEDMPEWQ